MQRAAQVTLVLASILGLGGACSATGGTHAAQGASSGSGGASSATAGGGQAVGGGIGTGGGPSASSSGSGAPMTCDPSAPDLAGCACNSSTARACYPATANPNTRGVGACVDGQQVCQGATEFAAWGPCTGAVTPVTENCTDGVDNDCNGKSDCLDPSCASDAACNGGCTNGDTRPCYDGPAGTEGTGICKPGTQTCTNGTWPSGCPGEVLPQQEVCSDFLDHNCNGLPGCFDFLTCWGDPACQPPPCMPSGGCTCPTGVGDAAVCPNGDYGDPLTGLCCACSASTCDQVGCCGESECSGSSVCVGFTCAPLAPSCNGMVNVDCDFEDLAQSDVNNPPEDCDQTCCKCKPTLCP